MVLPFTRYRAVFANRLRCNNHASPTLRFINKEIRLGQYNI